VIVSVEGWGDAAPRLRSLSRVEDKPDKDLVTASPNAHSNIHGFVYEAPSL